MRHIGTVSRGIRLPVVSKGADLVDIVCTELLKASGSDREPFAFRDGDIVGVTESLLARVQGNYATLEDIAEDTRRLVPEGDVSLIFPILSRNRFGQILKGIIGGVRGKVHILLSYPADEVGNLVIEPRNYYLRAGMLSADLFGEKEYEEVFGRYIHPFTGVDYVKYYREMDPGRVEIHFGNNPLDALKFADTVIVASIHARFLHREILEKAGAKVVSIDQFCTAPRRDGMGYNPEFGLLGSNYTNDGTLKLFPRDSGKFAKELQEELFVRTGKKIEVLVYGDGAFKDPVCGIWELADPVVSPGFTDGLLGMPKEIKLKYIADNAGDKSPEEAVREAIRMKGEMDRFSHSTLGTTPRRLTDLVGSLCDLTSGSGDKGTPVVHISGYFDSYLDE
ncbi:MAG: coenzyme F420-0:L-glutamate ligase [Synergistaceae bacterium]|nr:coenzyme F420-0:L-glutamate ligase [Synergistaceae bacterium]